jgi:hypothetical protein
LKDGVVAVPKCCCFATVSLGVSISANVRFAIGKEYEKILAVGACYVLEVLDSNVQGGIKICETIVGLEYI